jgi:hypothetical protein
MYTCTEHAEREDGRETRGVLLDSYPFRDESIRVCLERIPPEQWPKHLLVTAWDKADGGWQRAEESAVLDVAAWVRKRRDDWLEHKDEVRAAVARLESSSPRHPPGVSEGWLVLRDVVEGMFSHEVAVTVERPNGVRESHMVARCAVDLNIGCVLVKFWVSPPTAGQPSLCWVELPTPNRDTITVKRSDVRQYHC